MCTDRPTSGRYARDILALQEGLNFRSLLSTAVDRATYHAPRPDGMLTLGLRTDQLTDRHLLGLQGFRLAQYLQLGWVCEELIASRGIFCEPTDGLGADDLHLVTLSGTGEILGYLGLVGAHHGQVRPLADPGRARFPVETAHGIDLAELASAAGATRTDQVRELKRFVHRRSMTDRATKLRVTLELLLAAGRMIVHLPETRVVVGDVEEHVALRHLMMVGLQIHLVEGTTPQLTAGDYLHPAYTRRLSVKPFVAAVPGRHEVAARMDRLDTILASTDPAGQTRALVAECTGSVLRVAA